MITKENLNQVPFGASNRFHTNVAGSKKKEPIEPASIIVAQNFNFTEICLFIRNATK